MRWLLVVLAACGSRESPPTSTSTSSAPPIVSDALRKKVCSAEPCGGDDGSISVYRDASGTIKKLYRLYGPCSHNPGLYFDPDGRLTETIEEKPIEPGSEEAKEFQARHDAQVGGLRETDVIRCRDGSRRPPS